MMFTLLNILLPSVLAADFKYCGKHQVRTAGDVNVETNQWNNDNNLLTQCVDVAYDEARGTVSWDVEWQQPQKTIMPHGYPNLQLVHGVPVRVRDIVYLNAATSWTYQIVDAPEDTEMQSAGVRTNVAFDMFFDLDAKKAKDTGKASVEVMIWCAQFGRVVPLGYDSAPPTAEITLEGVDWWIYKASNVQGQTVITFLPKNGKRSPSVDWHIMDFLREVGKIFPDLFVPMLWMGHLQVGSELFEAVRRPSLKTAQRLTTLDQKDQALFYRYQDPPWRCSRCRETTQGC
ncbi:concanavalin A-like lectin/glucanase domain-containing protein [Protomyces lactucae-debilis]|uniref:Concanavalin A-like lectin/glucanase domain-containing protein n=1 Tax=Protomyces lactucae-debilis TaxID=2754530 RepID=A0A1Y2FXK0_PROLT|nr:concanavalin A-like lectin/glucanase domain-containing protein [Protomyces lactucae-debilis]ORY87906.1 concanavalin A-like lectin/glucanase domain-containing protein [Protomyces lactucae-debilis]